MKTKIQWIVTAGLLFAGMALFSGDQDFPKTIPAKLERMEFK